ncbi:hypothetical protein IGI04_007888 [Brassica rapa subsp. trilocularis]|uniref:Uncharacterized protein n=1 Tax=Brassica rapa subsp. trilocularis TaxID=1813537 RepID=A0ABQ7NPA3_BRACM|nr:hypothetical protein IGI04_007888 [Brassica rapa subsp. trilocularis]
MRAGRRTRVPQPASGRRELLFVGAARLSRVPSTRVEDADASSWRMHVNDYGVTTVKVVSSVAVLLSSPSGSSLTAVRRNQVSPSFVLKPSSRSPRRGRALPRRGKLSVVLSASAVNGIDSASVLSNVQLKDVVASLFELWNLMDTPQEERTKFGRVTYLVRSSESKITEPGILSTETIEQVSAEVDCLSKLKSSKMKELDMNRDNAGRAMVDNLIKKTLVCENDAQKLFLYDGVRLVNILEDYIPTRKQQEEDKKRYRKRQDLLLTQRESIYGSKPSPRRSSSFRKPSGYIINNGNGSVPPTPRRSSVGKATPDLLLTPRSYSGHHRQNGYFKEVRRLTPTPLNFVAIQKEDTVSSTYLHIDL